MTYLDDPGQTSLSPGAIKGTECVSSVGDSELEGSTEVTG